MYISHNKNVRKENFNLLHMNIYVSGASQVAQWWRICLPMLEVQGAQVRSLGQEDPLWEEMATHSSIFSWEILWLEEPGGATVHRVAKSWTQLSDWAHTHTSMYPRTIWYNVYSFTNILSWHSCWKSIGCKCKSLFLTLTLTLNQSIYPHTSHIVLLTYFRVSFKIRKCESFNFSSILFWIPWIPTFPYECYYQLIIFWEKRNWGL